MLGRWCTSLTSIKFMFLEAQWLLEFGLLIFAPHMHYIICFIYTVLVCLYSLRWIYFAALSLFFFPGRFSGVWIRSLRRGSISLLWTGLSPTQNTQRYVHKVLLELSFIWFLLISYISFSSWFQALESFYDQFDSDFINIRTKAREVLQREDDLNEIVQVRFISFTSFLIATC